MKNCVIVNGNIMKFKLYKLQFITNLNCNLNCKYCNVHAYKFKEFYQYNLNKFEEDCKYLSQITEPTYVYLLGGEALLLGYELLKYISLLRNYFKNSKLEMITNGILLTKYKQLIPFFDNIYVSKYSIIDLDYNFIKSLNPNIISVSDCPIKHYDYERPLGDGRIKVCNTFKVGHSLVKTNIDCVTVYNGYIYGCSRPVTSGMIYGFDYTIDGIKIDQLTTANMLNDYFDNTKCLYSCRYCNGRDKP